MTPPNTQDILKIGQLFAGRYTIVGTLGKGGFSSVYAARQLHLGRDVAIKIFAPRDLPDQDARERLAKRFMKEAQLLAQLNDPHTITLHDYGITAEGEIFQVFELIPGVTFKRFVNEQGPLPHERMHRVLEQILWSLAEAHSMGMIHRDIKPSNIMVYDHLDRLDCVKVLDFGVAKLIEDYDTAHSDVTADGIILGTPRYMSPEQIMGDTLTPSSDLYSLGIVVFEALFMMLPYDKELNLLRRRHQQMTTPVALPDWFEHPPLRRFLTRALAGDPDARYATAKEALRELKRSPVEDATLPFIKRSFIPDISSGHEAYDTAETPDTLTASRGLPDASKGSPEQPSSRSFKFMLPLLLFIILSLVGVIILLLHPPEIVRVTTPDPEHATTLGVPPPSSDPLYKPPIEALTRPDLIEPGELVEPVELVEDVAALDKTPEPDDVIVPEKVVDTKTAKKDPPPKRDPARPIVNTTTRTPEKPEPPRDHDLNLLPKTKTTPPPKKDDDVNLLPPKKNTSSGFVITPLDEK